MENKHPFHLQEVIFSSPIPQLSRQISNLVKAGILRKIAPRVYSPNKEESVEIIIRRNFLQNLKKNSFVGHTLELKQIVAQESNLISC